MSAETARSLADALRESTGDLLRSVAYYDSDGYGVVFLRDDVAEQYTDDEVDEVFQDVRLEALTKPRQEGLYRHGELECVVRCFAEAVEMHFAVTETTGVAVALDAEAFSAQRTFVGRCLDVVQSRSE